MEVRYATSQLSHPLLVRRRLHRLGSKPNWIGGIRFEFQQQRGQLSPIRIFGRVVLSFGGRLVRTFACEWRQLSFRGGRLESRLFRRLSEP